MKTLLRVLVAMMLASTVVSAAPADTKEKDKEADRLENAGRTMDEILKIPDNIPRDLLDRTKCIMVIPSVVKAAFIGGVSYGRGTMVCRSGKEMRGAWGAPAMMILEGGSVGFQIGAEATDYVLLVMNRRGAESMLHSKVKLGGDASVAAGPVGRTAEADSDAYMRAEILTYSRARGAFAGVSLEGASLRPDKDGNASLYGHSIEAQDIVFGRTTPAIPRAAMPLVSVLEKASPSARAQADR